MPKAGARALGASPLLPPTEATRDPLLDGVVLPAAVVDRLAAHMDALNDPDAGASDVNPFIRRDA